MPLGCIHTGITSVLPVSIHACRSAAFISISLTRCLPDAALRSAWLREKLTKKSPSISTFLCGIKGVIFSGSSSPGPISRPGPLAAKTCVDHIVLSFFCPMLIWVCLQVLFFFFCDFVFPLRVLLSFNEVNFSSSLPARRSLFTSIEPWALSKPFLWHCHRLYMTGKLCCVDLVFTFEPLYLNSKLACCFASWLCGETAVDLCLRKWLRLSWTFCQRWWWTTAVWIQVQCEYSCSVLVKYLFVVSLVISVVFFFWGGFCSYIKLHPPNIFPFTVFQLENKPQHSDTWLVTDLKVIGVFCMYINSSICHYCSPH